MSVIGKYKMHAYINYMHTYIYINFHHSYNFIYKERKQTDEVCVAKQEQSISTQKYKYNIFKHQDIFTGVLGVLIDPLP